MPVGYLSKVLQQLTRAGIITSQRGIGGGFKLSRSPEQITINDVVQAVDSVPRIRKCPLGLEDHQRLCPLHRKLDAAMAQVEAAFAETSLADLTTESSGLCKIKKSINDD